MCLSSAMMGGPTAEVWQTKDQEQSHSPRFKSKGACVILVQFFYKINRCRQLIVPSIGIPMYLIKERYIFNSLSKSNCKTTHTRQMC